MTINGHYLWNAYYVPGIMPGTSHFLSYLSFITPHNVFGEGEDKEPGQRHEYFTHKINEAERG